MSLSVAEQLALLPEDELADLIGSYDDATLAALLRDWHGFLSRPEQLAPPGDWSIWLILTGRGWGKTRTAAELVLDWVLAGKKLIGGLGRTAADARDVMVLGPSGLLACASGRGIRARYIAGRRQVYFPDYQATFLLFTAEVPDQTRGQNFEGLWIDEAAIFDDSKIDAQGNTAISNALLALREGRRPQCVITTTPKPKTWLRDMVAEARDAPAGSVRLTTGSTFDNAANLAAPFITEILGRYRGTRIEAQEIHGQLVMYVEGALWSPDLIDRWRIRGPVPPLEVLRIGVDPSGTVSGECGIVLAGLARAASGPYAVVLADATMPGDPKMWGPAVARLAREAPELYGAPLEHVVFEANFGHGMGRQVLRAADPNLRVRMVHASTGKKVRAEPVALMTDQGRVQFAGYFPDLEAQLTSWVPNEGMKSPDRLDAMVWVVASLLGLILSRRSRSTVARGQLPAIVRPA